MIRYKDMVQAVFKERPNRFIAHCEIDGQEVVAHVKNTGKCRELLVPGVTVYLQHHDNPKRKTAYSLIGVQKGARLINMDSQVPNKVCIEALKNGKLKLPGIDEPFTLIKGEYTYGNSRFDVYVETENEKAFIEVKGVTLEEDGVVRFPDAPTERGIKHLKELMAAQKDGYKVYVLFVIQMCDVMYFTPNDGTHKAFGDTLREADANGVHILAYDTVVEVDGIELGAPVALKL
ncbi:MAG: DNA/RNA nuclease SfsA [Cellulosilyticaceae bacterium]